MTNMTAVEQFFKDLVHLGYIEYPNENLLQDRLNLALEMFEQQMKDAFIEGHNVCRCVTDNTDEAKECFDEWFKTYKKDEI